jgi:AcrR family transcriptional regulator
MTCRYLADAYTCKVRQEVPGLRQRKKDRTRRALVDAAMRLFADRGYEETTIADLADAADISPRTFFSYFAAKEDVLFADVDDRISALAELEFRRSDERPLDALRRLGGEVAERIRGNPEDDGSEAPRGARVTRQIIDGRPSLHGALLLRLRAADQMLASRLHGAFPDELDEVLAAAVVGAFTAGLRAGAEAAPGSPPSATDPQPVIDRVLRLLTHGLGATPP